MPKSPGKRVSFPSIAGPLAQQAEPLPADGVGFLPLEFASSTRTWVHSIATSIPRARRIVRFWSQQVNANDSRDRETVLSAVP
jgi:hypothetical protein